MIQKKKKKPHIKASDVSKAIMETKIPKTNASKLLNNFQPRILYPAKLLIKSETEGTSLMVQWWRLYSFIAGGASSIPCQGTEIHATQHGQKKKRKTDFLEFTSHTTLLMKNDLLHQNKGITQNQRRHGIQEIGDSTKEVKGRSQDNWYVLDIKRGRHGNPLQYSCLKNPHGERSLVG